MSQRITITLPDEVYQKVKDSAERDFRTIGAEIAYLLHMYVPTYRGLTLDDNQISPRHINTSSSIPTSIPTPENPTGQTHTPTSYTSHINYKRTVID